MVFRRGKIIFNGFSTGERKMTEHKHTKKCLEARKASEEAFEKALEKAFEKEELKCGCEK